MTLHRNAARVQAALDGAGSRAQVREVPDSAHTAVEAAEALGVDVAQIAKSLVFLADGNPVLVVLSGADRLDPGRLGELVGARSVKRADADTVRAATGFPIGGVSPLGHTGGLRIVIDEALARYEEIWAAAGTPNAVFPTTFEELLRLTGGRSGDVAAR